MKKEKYKIKLSDIEGAIEQAFRQPNRQERTIKLYTGVNGMWNFNWIVLYGSSLDCTFYLNQFKKVKSFKYLSLFERNGKYKLKVFGSTFEFYKGTKLIKTIEGVTNGFIPGSGDIYAEDTKLKMKEVNTFAKNLYFYSKIESFNNTQKDFHRFKGSMFFRIISDIEDVEKYNHFMNTYWFKGGEIIAYSQHGSVQDEYFLKGFNNQETIEFVSNLIG